MHEAEAPAAIVVDHHEKKHAAGVSGAGCTMCERPGLVVGVGPALPVADADRTVRPARIRIRTGKNRTQQNCDRSSTAFHKLFPTHPGRAYLPLQPESIWTMRQGRIFPVAGSGKIGRGIGFMPAGGPTAEALSLSSLPDHSAHRLDRRKIDADSHPPAAQQLIAWQDTDRTRMDLAHGGDDFRQSDVLRPPAVVLIPGLRDGILCLADSGHDHSISGQDRARLQYPRHRLDGVLRRDPLGPRRQRAADLRRRSLHRLSQHDVLQAGSPSRWNSGHGPTRRAFC